MSNFYALVAFNLFVLGMLALDLGVFQRRARAVSLREAALWTGLWVLVALGFNVGVALWRGPHSGLEFLTGYILEASLSLDNVFVFAVIFTATAVPSEVQHKVLFWGVLGALVMRAAFVVAGVALVSRYHWVLYLFGIFLTVSGVKLFLGKPREIHVERNPLLRSARKIFPITERYEGASFFVRRTGKRLATPLFLVLVMVETADIVFALDSIPAIFAVTQDPFIVYTSNVLAVLGLRSMYLLLAGTMARFRYLRAGVSLVLVFVGVKMLLARFTKLPIWVVLSTISAILAVAGWASQRGQRKPKGQVPF